MTDPDLSPYLDAYRAQRLQGVPEESARRHLFARLLWDRPASSLLRIRSEINERLQGIEEEIAEESTRPPAA